MSERDVFTDTLGAALARTAASIVERTFDADAYTNARFAQWLTNDAMAAQTLPERRATDAAARTFADRMRGKILAESAAVPVMPLRVRGEDVDDVGVRVVRERYVPWFDSSAVAAGTGRELWDEPSEQWVQVPRDTSRRAIAVSVNGDSMVPLLASKDVVVVNVGAPARQGVIVVARHPDHGWVVKRVRRMRGGFLELESLNAAYAPFTIARGPGVVLGVVTAILRRE